MIYNPIKIQTTLLFFQQRIMKETQNLKNIRFKENFFLHFYSPFLMAHKMQLRQTGYPWKLTILIPIFILVRAPFNQLRLNLNLMVPDLYIYFAKM